MRPGRRRSAWFDWLTTALSLSKGREGGLRSYARFAHWRADYGMRLADIHHAH